MTTVAAYTVRTLLVTVAVLASSCGSLAQRLDAQPATTTTFSQCHLAGSDHPDPACNPGATNPRVTQDNLGQTVCSTRKINGQTWSRHEREVYLPGWAASTRKRQMLTAYNLRDAARYELDHLVPISAGGSPDAAANTWPEPWDGPHGAHAKDRIEVDTWHKLCAGQLTLTQAQAVFLQGRW